MIREGGGSRFKRLLEWAKYIRTKMERFESDVMDLISKARRGEQLR